MASKESEDIKVIDAGDLVCYSLEVNLWSGRQTLTRERLMEYAPNNRLPPAELATMGSVRIADAHEVQSFNRLKSEALRILRDHGLPIMGAIGVPKSQAAEVHLKLREIQRKFNELRQSLFIRYDQASQAWRAKWISGNPGAGVLLNRMPTAEEVAGKLRFNFHVYRISAPSGDVAGGELDDLYHESLMGIKGELFSDIAREASDLMTKYLVRKQGDVATEKERISRKTLRPLQRVVAKLKSFAFVDPSVEPLREVVESGLNQLPADGPIVGASLLQVWALVRMLANPVECAKVAEQARALSSHERESHLFDLLPGAQMAGDALGAPIPEPTERALPEQGIALRNIESSFIDVLSLL